MGAGSTVPCRPRRLAVVLAVGACWALASTGPAGAAVAFVQKGVEASGSGTTVTATLPSGSTAGHLLVAAIMDLNSGCAGDVFSAPAGWVKAAHSCRGGTGPVELWYYANAPGGIASVNFGTGSSGANTRAQLSEYSGADTSSPLDQTGTANSGSSSTSLVVTTSGNVEGPGEVGITVFATSQGLTSFTAGGGWTSLKSDPAGGFDSDYRLNPASGGTLSETVTSNPQTTWGAVIVTFAPPCAGGSLSLAIPGSVSFPSVTLNGTNRTSTASPVLTPDDETGTGSGWNVTGTSTTFKNAGAKTLSTSATTLISASAAAATGNCTLPTNSIGYPLTLPAAASAPAAVKIYNAAANTGAGPTDITLNFSVAVPANAYAGSYTSTWTFSVVSGP